MSFRRRLLILSCLGLLGAGVAHPAFAEAPVDISAGESLEWYQDQKLYVARGAARAVRGTLSVEADLLTAQQKAGANSQEKKTSGGVGGDLSLLTAEGQVRIKDTGQEIFGDKAVYDLERRLLRVTGSNLKYLSGKDVVTAKESLEYHEDKAVAYAKGRAVAEHESSRIEADLLAAQFVKTPAGQTEMSQMTARGGVIIVTKDGGVSRGDRAVYDVKRDVATLMDNVRITRGQTQLAGDRAEVNFATGQSRLLTSGSGRVRALLPGSGEKSGGGKP